MATSFSTLEVIIIAISSPGKTIPIPTENVGAANEEGRIKDRKNGEAVIPDKEPPGIVLNI